MGKTVLRYILFCISLSFFTLFSSESVQLVYEHSFKKMIMSESDQSSIPPCFTIKSCQGVSDGAFTLSNLKELTDLVPGVFFTREQFLKSIERVSQTQSCNKITFVFSGDPESISVFCTIECDWIVRSVKLQGISLGKSEYLQLYDLIPGEPFDLEKHEQSLEVLKKFLYKQGYQKAQVTYKIQYDTNKKWVSVTILIKKGAFSFPEKEVQEDRAHLNKISLPSLLVAQEMRQEYVNKGFYKAIVESVDQEFVVTKGPRCSVKKIIIQGATVYDHKWIEKKFFKNVQRSRYFDEKRVHESLDLMIQWYKKEGFWDAKIIRHDYVLYQEQKHIYALKIVIQEGEQRFISDIDIDGVPSEWIFLLPGYQELLKKREQAIKQIPFSVDLIGKQRSFLLKALRDHGFLKTKLSYTLKQKDDGLVIHWSCTKNKKTMFGKTIMKGQTKISYDYLTKLLSYKEGQLWNKEKIQRSLITLRSTGVFDRVNLFPSFKDLVEGQRDIILTVKDDDPFEVKLRMGFAQVSKNFYFKKGSTYTVGGSFIWKNPFSRADKFSADLDFNRYEQKINLAYRLPFLGNIPLATIFKGYANKYIQPIVIGSSKPLYQVLQEGFLIGLSKSGLHYDCGLTSGFEWMEINDLSLKVAQAINFETTLVDKKIPYFFIEPMIYSDFLDDKVNPTKGFFSMASLKGMFPFKESSYFVKMIIEYGTFISIFSSILGLHFRAGHIFRTDFKAIMPSERFFLGGPFSLRGYLQDYCPPLGSYITDAGLVQHVPQGGKTMLNSNFELRIPLYKKTMWATVFQDFGILMENPRDFFTRSRPLAATGFGFRYLTPIGPLRFDIGWKWHADQSDVKSYAWFLTLGNAF